MHSTSLESVIKTINTLSIKEKKHILNILFTYKIEYTKNSNGYFFNLLYVDQSIISKIQNCLDLMTKTRSTITKLYQDRTNTEKMYKELIEKSLEQTRQQKKA